MERGTVAEGYCDPVGVQELSLGELCPPDLHFGVARRRQSAVDDLGGAP